MVAYSYAATCSASFLALYVQIACTANPLQYLESDLSWLVEHSLMKELAWSHKLTAAPYPSGMIVMQSTCSYLVQGPMKLMDEGFQKYGEVFTVPVVHKNITFLLGPHASPHFFKASDEDMSQKEVRNRACNTQLLLLYPWHSYMPAWDEYLTTFLSTYAYSVCIAVYNKQAMLTKYCSTRKL